MTTPEQIEALLKPHNCSLKALPVSDGQDYAYEERDRKTAFQMAKKWQGSNYNIFNPDMAEEDFICHQSDVIEILCQALSIANRKLGINGKKENEIG